jgi:hypothetical protein
MNRCCDKCGQPLPAEVRRDPPLPPLDHPAVLTIHDLPAGTKYRVKQLAQGEGSCRKLVLTPDAVDARERRG